MWPQEFGQGLWTCHVGSLHLNWDQVSAWSFLFGSRVVKMRYSDLSNAQGMLDTANVPALLLVSLYQHLPCSLPVLPTAPSRPGAHKSLLRSRLPLSTPPRYIPGEPGKGRTQEVEPRELLEVSCLGSSIKESAFSVGEQGEDTPGKNFSGKNLAQDKTWKYSLYYLLNWKKFLL